MYKCLDCNHTFEEDVIDDENEIAPVLECPACGSLNIKEIGEDGPDA